MDLERRQDLVSFPHWTLSLPASAPFEDYVPWDLTASAAMISLETSARLCEVLKLPARSDNLLGSDSLCHSVTAGGVLDSVFEVPTC
jgi:hypothetical protein